MKSININKLLPKRINIYGADFPNMRYVFMHKKLNKKNNLEGEIQKKDNQTKSNNFWLKTIMDPINLQFFREKERKIIKEMKQKEDIHYTIVCDNVNKFVKKNAQINPTHNLFYKYKFSAKILGFFCREKSYVHSCGYQTENFNVTYDVIDSEKLIYNLNNWTDYHIAYLMQKPYTELYSTNDNDIEKAQEKNLMNTLSFALYSLLPEDSIEEYSISSIEIEEKKLFNTITNLSNFAYEHETIINSNEFNQNVDKDNLHKYQMLYFPIIKSKKFNEIITYNYKKKVFVLNHSLENKKKLRNLLAPAIINNSWPNLKFSKKIWKLFAKDKSRKQLFLRDYFYLLTRQSKNTKNKLAFSMNKIMNNQENVDRNFRRKFAKLFMKLFALGYSIWAILDSIKEFYLNESDIKEHLIKSQTDLMEFNFIDREEKL